MFKRLLESFIKNRLEKLDNEINDLSNETALKDFENSKKSAVSRILTEVDNETQIKVLSLKNRVVIYNVVFGQLS